MSLTGTLAAFALRHTLNESADKIVSAVEQHFTDRSQLLPRVLNKANDRTWQAVGLALAGDSLFDRVKGLIHGGDMTALRDQLRAFLAATPTGLEASPAELRARACDELIRLRKVGRLSLKSNATDVAADIRRYSDASKLVASVGEAVATIADALADDAPNLAQILRLTPPGGSPLLAVAFLYFFRRGVEGNEQLSRGLTFDSLRTLTAAQERGFALLDGRTEGILDQFNVLFDALGDWFASADGKLNDIRAKLDKLLDDRDVQRGTTRPLKVSVTNEKELAQLRRWRDELRKFPPELLEAADWSKLGDALAAGHLMREAQESHQAAARAAVDPRAEAEAQIKVYRDACEREHWDDALRALIRAAELDPRFQPFPFNEYEPVCILGAGGFGTVIRCRQRLAGGREVAVKTFHTSDLGRDLGDVFAEGHTLSELAAPGIVQVFAFDYADEAQTRPFIVMEYFPGDSLANYLKQSGPLPVAEFVPVARQVAQAMASAHTAKILHRDLKPGNILVCRNQEGWDTRVIDFGLAVRFSTVQASISTSLPHRTRRDQSFAGSVEYASPEQKGLIRGEVGPQSDVYSFGKTMLEALLGTTESTTKAWRAVPDEYRDQLRELLEGCVEKNPSDRHAGFEPIAQALVALDPVEKAKRERLERDAEERKRQAEETERARIAAEVALKRQSEQAERVRVAAEAARIAVEKQAREDAEQRKAEVSRTAAEQHPKDVEPQRQEVDRSRHAEESRKSITLAIIPGQSIGPFRLGMTRQEVEHALWSLSPEPLTIDDLGIVAWFPNDENPQVTDRCTQLGIRVYNNPHTILLRGQPVNDIGNEEAIRFFESFADRLDHSYGGFDALSAGIRVSRWENSDPWIDSISVITAEYAACQQEAMDAAVAARENDARRHQEAIARYEHEEEERAWRAAEEAAQKAADETNPNDRSRSAQHRLAGERVTLKLSGGVPITFAWCPPGEFRMGSDHPGGWANEQPAHIAPVTQGFFIGIYPVTQAQWSAVMGTAPSRFIGPNRPVERVSWDDCQSFCTTLTAILSERVRVRLPTEVEWEYACRAGTTRAYHFGWTVTPDLANYDGTSSWNDSPTGRYRGETTDVGWFPANPWGLHDVHGNVFEWCEDRYDWYRVEGRTRPPLSGDNRVVRGGGWPDPPACCRSTSRDGAPPGAHEASYGFRVCFTLAPDVADLAALLMGAT